LLGPQIVRPRPDSYWTASANPLEAVLRNMKGRQRRRMVRDYYAAGKLEELGDSLLSDSLDDEARKRLSLIHPTFMGWEYLPDYCRHETEIVRIELDSTTYDVISLRARPVGSRIEYNLVYKYESEFTLPQQTSRRPFSLRQLIRFLDSIQRIETGDPSWDRFGFVLHLTNATWSVEQTWKTSKISLRCIPISILISPRITHERSLNGKPPGSKTDHTNDR